MHPHTAGLQDLADISSSQQKMPVMTNDNPVFTIMQPSTSCSSVPLEMIVSSHENELHVPLLSPLKKSRHMLQDSAPEMVSVGAYQYPLVDVQTSAAYTLPLGLSMPEHLHERHRDSEAVYLASTSDTETTINPNEILYQSDSRHSVKTKSKHAVDEEFSHMTETENLETSPPQSTAPPVQPKPVAPTKAAKDSSFQSSFLSFLQGEKPETLSSVTNSPLAVKPQLPKYIPELNPRRPLPETPAKPKAVNKSVSTVSTPAVKPKPSSHNVVKSESSGGYCNIIITGDKTPKLKIKLPKKAEPKTDTVSVKPGKKKTPAKPKKAAANKVPEVVIRERSKRKAKEVAETRRKQKKTGGCH
jgi:hypothetical protein